MLSGRYSKVLFSLTVSALVFTGCASPREPAGSGTTPSQAARASAPAADVELTVSAAASLTVPLREIQKNYESKHSGIRLIFNFGASGALQQQIEQGAPADLFLSASAKNMKALVDKQYIDDSQHTSLLRGELVVVVPADGGSDVHTMEDLNADAVKHLAVGEPQTVPAGGYAKEALVKAKAWDTLQPKILQGKDVRQVLTYVESGNAEAGFVYRTDALASTRVKVAFSVDPASYTPIEYPAGIVKATKHSSEANDFYTYLQSKEAYDVFIKYGFKVPE
ncbi:MULTISPECIES: molybdate ABC transporter substrate-binding protein [Paenibacillus]|uniref:molybdate ABC transporter substrate-binding protein n=1 Tax=Paenibacillus TaxID=44249 RepID=UPI0022B8AC6D|nr:molybdate ABC transporter substrate-binding protein [Paenibacillus caseinilyticus]MCZ8521799.1 molybdate ABC transporter substrate-binding protein [Paenibacillus caseinilyticus]